jgi:hypothetical protein
VSGEEAAWAVVLQWVVAKEEVVLASGEAAEWGVVADSG